MLWLWLASACSSHFHSYTPVQARETAVVQQRIAHDNTLAKMTEQHQLTAEDTAAGQADTTTAGLADATAAHSQQADQNAKEATEVPSLVSWPPGTSVSCLL